MPRSTMNLPCRLEILLISLCIQVGFVSGMHCKDGTADHLSREDALLLKDEQNPKCFTRTGEDFTCFFETADDRTYDLLCRGTRCEMSVQKTEEGAFLHICSFPDFLVPLFVETHIEVVERNTNTSLYKRTVCVEDHFLLDPPFNVSLHQNGQPGQLQVLWALNVSKYISNDVIYRIRYSSELGWKTKEGKEGNILDSLVPGEEVEVQVTVKYAFNSDSGHWSSWSQPVRAVAPQRADDISLMCFTSDLQNIVCQWNGSRYGVEKEYKLFYKMGPSEALARTGWTECLAERNFTDLCRFHGDESRKVRVKLSSTPAPLSRTFYTQEFTLYTSIKTPPPSHLRGALEKDKLCLKWVAPLPSLSAHLQYEVRYRIREGGMWVMPLKGPETATCLDVPTGSQYSVNVRAKPIGTIYSGNWSDWSDVLTGDTPTDRDALLLLCVPVSLLITAIIFISLFPTYLSKLKLFLWPPVPNLDKVLQGFLTEINGQKWNPPLTAKQCLEETTSSVVEIMSEDEVLGLGKPSEESTQLLSAEGNLSSREPVDGSPGSESFPDYVTLNKDNVIQRPKGNAHVGEKEGPAVKDELFQTSPSPCAGGSVCTPPCLGTDILNHSYLPLAEPAHRFNCKVTPARGPGNLYTNFPCG
ncbi:thrombopoietin receptor isoform X2 [Chelmon rostratus]|uniref:thrombopoietin receptor isoform X2 n=1 Tax=Chelmon rostratus TaxID=109905 RepID=UPI001BED19B6|nr:thrombopoietin receptor isoform X2 [Chelmon rostratus]